MACRQVLFSSLLLWLWLSGSFASADDERGGTLTGVIAAKSADSLLIRPEVQPPRRLFLTGGVVPTTQPDAAVATTFDSLVVGDEVAAQWTQDTRRRIVALKFLRHPPPASQPAVAIAPRPTLASPATQPARAALPTSVPAISSATITNDAHARSTTGEAVNAALDDLLAFGSRVTELPLTLLLTAAIVLATTFLLIARKFIRAGRPMAAGRLRVACCCVTVLLAASLADRKLLALQGQINSLQAKFSREALANGGGGAAKSVASAGRLFFFDRTSAEQSLAAHFTGVDLQPSIYNKAIDVVPIHFDSPLVSAYLAIVDLTSPAVQIKLGTDLDEKTLTSDFAKANDCTLAINGEAGQSPAMNSGLGPWRGHLVYNGQVLATEEAGNPRPFIAFDSKNHAVFRTAAADDRTVPAGAASVIWGRLDSIRDGQVETADERYRQPRTAMGLSADGTKLFLLVIDGRQSRYSVGLKRAEVGYVLSAFGAANAMLCDEGGSSCIYLAKSGGIANIPCDNAGERPTYTHFGVSIRGEM